VVKDVLTLSARIEENQKRIVKTFSNVVLFRCAQFLNFFPFSSPKGDVVEDFSDPVHQGVYSADQ
jgi:hypothetical protein